MYNLQYRITALAAVFLAAPKVLRRKLSKAFAAQIFRPGLGREIEEVTSVRG